MEGNNNPYNNELALKELIKMMRRGEKLTISFVLDKYGYESIEIESKRVEKFTLQLSNELYAFLYKYLNSGTITDPIPSPTDNLINGTDANSNDFAEEILKKIIIYGEELPYMHIVPEIIDKPNRLTVTIRYPNGISVFKIRRSKNIVETLASKGF